MKQTFMQSNVDVTFTLHQTKWKPFSDDVDQSIDEHMTKFKGHSSMRQYLTYKMGF